MKEDFIGKLKKIAGWTGFGIFLFWALCLLAAGNPVSAVLTTVFAFFISPLRKKMFEKFNISLKGKKFAFTAGFLFLSSCGTFLGLTDVEETSDSTAYQREVVVEEMDSALLETAEIETSTMLAENETAAEAITEASSETESTERDILETTTEDASETTIDAEKKEQASAENAIEDTDIAEMQVHFIDVGQGDATLITCGEEAMLIDAGDNSKGTAVQLYLKKQGVKKLKYLVLTHPDADHIGGADVVITKFDIETVFMSNYTKDNKTYDEVIRALDDKGLKWSTPNVGNTYKLGSAEFTIIAPNTTYSDPNNESIGLVLRNGEDSFLFTGDAEEDAEYDILANGLDIDCDVYKAGHHGSKTASTQELLDAATPEYVVISCAEGNSYGHPHAGPMNSFRSMGMKLFRTDEQGSIVATSGGTEITWSCAPSDSWKAGENTQSSVSKSTSTNTSQQSGATSTVTQSSASKSSTAVQAASAASTTQSAVSEQVEEPAVVTEAPAIVEEPVITEAPAVVEEPVADPNAGIMVWKSATGKKYHSKNNCGNMNPNKATQITKAEAVAQGLGQCSKCW